MLSSSSSSGRSGTTGYGISGQISCGTTLGISVEYVYDNNGNKGIAISVIPLTGGGTPSVSAAGIRSTTNADSICDLRGWGTNGGVSASYIVGWGEEGNWGDGYSGQTTAIGIKSWPEVHANRSYTWIPITWK